MSKSFITSQRIGSLLFIIVLIASIKLCQAAPDTDSFLENQHIPNSDEVQQQRRTHLKQLRHFLLTSSAEERAAKREEQNFFKRELINEYLQSVDDPNRLQEIKKRIKTFCSSYEDILNSDQATCG